MLLTSSGNNLTETKVWNFFSEKIKNAFVKYKDSKRNDAVVVANITLKRESY